jgi:hypothetical protein
MSMNEPPIRKELVLPIDPARAFDVLTAGIAEWWPMDSHSVGGDETVDVTLDGRRGGEIAETTRDGARHVWGTISVWDPPGRLVTTWHPGHPPTAATELEIRIEAHAVGSRLVLEHRGWEREAWVGQRESYETGWDPVLARYEAVVAEIASPMSPGPA